VGSRVECAPPAFWWPLEYVEGVERLVLTTTIDGLWALQALTGVEQTCPELGLRPLLPRIETAERVSRHPAAADLAAAGALDDHGAPDPMIREWLTVLQRRDLGLLMHIGIPDREPIRVSISRFASWWVVLERLGDQVRLYPAGSASDETGASALLVGQIERLCGVADAAALRPVTFDAQDMLASVRDGDSMRRFLMRQRLDGDQFHLLMMAADPRQSAQATIAAIQAGAGSDQTARLGIADTTVTIIDTAAGRVCTEILDKSGHRYQIVKPGSRANIAAAVGRLVRDLPAGDQWFSHRRIV
jgi:hypothetical protein